MEFVDFMGEILSSDVCLDSQLKLGHNLSIYHYFQGYIARGDRIHESTFDFCYTEPGVCFDEAFDFFDGIYDVLNLQKDTLASDHAAVIELHTFPFL